MIRVEPCTDMDQNGWIALRRALWPQPDAEHRREMATMLDHPERFAVFIARGDDGAALGFAEASLRHDYVNGCETSPVGFLEGIYVAPVWRRRGVARLLVRAVEVWAKGLGCTELASDTETGNVVSQQMHGALGFEEMERVVCFRKRLPREG